MGSAADDQVDESFFDVDGAPGNHSLVAEYTIGGLDRAQTYAFRYRAINVNGPGEWSAQALITAATVPSPPLPPARAGSTDSEIVLALSRTADDGGLAVTDYNLEMDQGVSSGSLISSDVSVFAAVPTYAFATDGFSFSVDGAALGLTSGALYRFRWRAVNFMGNSPWSDTFRIGLGALPAAPAGAPSRLVDADDEASRRNSRTSIGVQWPEVAGGALPVVEYALYMNDGYTAAAWEVYRGPLPFTRVEGLSPGAQYTFTASAFDFNGEGSLSSSGTLSSCVVPSGVQPPRLFAQSSTSVTLRWEHPDDDGGCPVSGYKIYRDDGADGAITTPVTFEAGGAPTQDTAEPYLFEHLVELGSAFSGLSVRFTLEAINSEGSTLSPGYLAAFVAQVPDAPAAGPTRVSSTRDSLSVSLPEVAGDGGLTLDAYQLWIDDAAGGEFA